MTAVIISCGMGTHISEESHFRPKPMIEIGGKDILWHIMLTYGDGVTDIHHQNQVATHRKSKKLFTLSSFQLPGRPGNRINKYS